MKFFHFYYLINVILLKLMMSKYFFRASNFLINRHTRLTAFSTLLYGSYRHHFGGKHRATQMDGAQDEDLCYQKQVEYWDVRD